MSAMPPTQQPTSSALAVFWTGDTAVADGKLEPAEAIVLAYDSSAQELDLYQPIALSKMTANQYARATTVLPAAELSDPAAVASFEATDYVQKIPIGQNVTAASFAMQNSSSTTTAKTFEFALSFSQSGQDLLQYGSVSLRAQVAPQ